MSEQLVIKNHEGKDVTINVIDIVLDNETGKQYIFYSEEGYEDIFAAILIEKDDNFVFQAIADESEMELVNEILRNKLAFEGDADE